jgi:hypothetical protein
LNVIARIDVPARDDAVDLRDDVTITKIQFGLSEIAVGGFEFSRGLLDGRSPGRELSKIASISPCFANSSSICFGL